MLKIMQELRMAAVLIRHCHDVVPVSWTDPAFSHVPALMLLQTHSDPCKRTETAVNSFIMIKDLVFSCFSFLKHFLHDLLVLAGGRKQNCNIPLLRINWKCSLRDTDTRGTLTALEGWLTTAPEEIQRGWTHFCLTGYDYQIIINQQHWYLPYSNLILLRLDFFVVVVAKSVVRVTY